MIEALRVQMKNIQSRIEKAERLGPPHWPLNEADTERLVIEPVLQALGYDEFDYAKHSQGQGADFPDYIILPTSDQRWVLEVKQWDARLGVREERQAVNYARNNNAQWAVLTNGRQWWIYHVSFGGLNQQRMQEVPDICDIDSAIRILKYLSPASMRQNELGLASRALKIRAAVLAELRRENGKLVKTTRGLVADGLDMNVTVEDINDAVKLILLGEPQSEGSQTQEDSAETAEGAISATDESRERDGGFISLAVLARDPDTCTGRKPLAVKHGGVSFPLRTWKDLAIFVVEETDALASVDLPLAFGRAKRYFLNAEPMDSRGRHMVEPREVRDSTGRLAYMETHYSASNILRSLALLMSEIDVDLDGFEVEVS